MTCHTYDTLLLQCCTGRGSYHWKSIAMATRAGQVQGLSIEISAESNPTNPSIPLNLSVSNADQEGEWETDDSDNDDLIEDILTSELEECQLPEDSTDSICCQTESHQLRRRLREIGPEKFLEETLFEGGYSAKKLCSAFRIPVLGFSGNDEQLYSLLMFAIHQELSRRKRLEQHQTIEDAAKLLNESKNIIVITGAGISTSLGIPDFRSKNTGFYSKLREKGFADPEALFTLEEFDLDPSGFYSLAGDLVPVQGKWSPTHQFIRLLQDKGKLLRDYTQNIDNVESYAGIAPEKIIHCHGSWKTASCRKCKSQVPGEHLFDSLRNKKVAFCKVCEQRLAIAGTQMKRKRSSQSNSKPRKKGDLDDDDEMDDDIPQPGVMKPDITFFGESLPNIFYDTLNGGDRENVDLIIVMGTSMKVAPVSEIPQHVESSVPQIYISRDPIGHIEFDINLLGDCDLVIQELCRKAGWAFEHEMIVDSQEIEVKPHQELSWAHTVTPKTPDNPSQQPSNQTSSQPSVTIQNGVGNSDSISITQNSVKIPLASA